jgi:hypothetical protein
MTKIDQVAVDEKTVYLPDTRGVVFSRWGKGNSKLGPDVYTYSRAPGKAGGTCPGATGECELICYAKRVRGPVRDVWELNSLTEELPDTLPPGAKIIRIHVSGDFSTQEYICNWVYLVRRYPDVRFFGYTRSWRVDDLYGWLLVLRNEPNVQLFASVDKSMQWPDKMPDAGWRRAWLEDDPRINAVLAKGHNMVAEDGTPALVCPEETGRKPNCQACRYCIDGKRNDVVFLIH